MMTCNDTHSDGIYSTRHQARKVATGNDIIVRVDDGNGGIGYKAMDAADYNIWRKQR